MLYKRLIVFACALALWATAAHAQTSFSSGITTGSSPPSMTAGPGISLFAQKESTAPGSPAGICPSGIDALWADSGAHAFKMCTNGSGPSLLGSVESACWFTGSTADVQLNAAIAALPAGGTIDARCYGATTQTLAAQVTFGNFPYTLKLDRATKWNITISNGTSAGIFAPYQTSIVCEGEAGAAGGYGFSLANGANVVAEVELGQNSGGAGGSLENCTFNGNTSATVSKGLVYVNNTGNGTTLRGLQTTGGGLYFGQNFGPIYVEGGNIDCSSVAGCVPVILDQSAAVTFISGVYVHPGATGHHAFYVENNSNVSNAQILWLGTSTELTNSTDIGWDMVACANCGIINCSNSCAGGGSCGTSAISFSGLSNNDVVTNYKNVGSATDTVTDSTTSPTIHLTNANTPTVMFYMPGQFTHQQGWMVNGQALTSGSGAGISGGGTLSTGSNSLSGRITGLAASSNILTPGFSCANAVTCIFQDDTTVGGIKVTAQSQTTETFSATASDTADYWCGCR